MIYFELISVNKKVFNAIMTKIVENRKIEFIKFRGYAFNANEKKE